jgi:hypothetical protein
MLWQYVLYHTEGTEKETRSNLCTQSFSLAGLCTLCALRALCALCGDMKVTRSPS